MLTVIGMRGDRERLAAPGSGQALGAHQPLHGAARDADAFPVELGPHLVGAVDEQVLGVDPADLHDQLGVPAGPLRRRPLAGHPVGVRGDLAAVLGEHPADRLDPEPVPVGVDEGDHLGDWRSSSAPKKCAAAFKISFARRSSLFSRSSSRIRARSSVVNPGR